LVQGVVRIFNGFRRYASLLPCQLPLSALCLLTHCHFSLFNIAMKTKPFLELADIKAIASAAEAEALKNNWAVAIAIVDDGGHLLWLQRLDGAAPLTAHIAPAKANTAALGRRESRIYEEIINNGRTSFLSVPDIKGMLEGGVAIIKDGHCIGAVGVSGVKSSEDAQIAKVGIAAIGL
jgi:glc operon protein GlcG